jgi:putative hemolysin
MTELLVILLLLVLNGIFAMTEIAILSAPRTKLRQLAEPPPTSNKAPHEGAQIALDLAADPEMFLSSVQVMLTLLGTLASVFGGASLAAMLKPWLEAMPTTAPYAENLAFGIVVFCITYLSVIVGELVPKSLAMRKPVEISCAMAKPMRTLATLTSPVVRILRFNTRVVMALFGKDVAPTGPTADEVRVLVREGMVAGGIKEEEADILQDVLLLRNLVTEEVMRPKPKVVFLNREHSREEVLERVKGAEDQHVFPIYEGHSRDEIVGMVSLQQLLLALASDSRLNLQQAMGEPLFVPENEPVLSLIESLRKSELRAALVTDEFGTVRGMVTLEDVAEEVIGHIHPPTPTETEAILKTGPTEWLVDGIAEVDDVALQIPEMETAANSEAEPFQSMAGYLQHKLDRQPMEGDKVEAAGLQIEVVDMDMQRVDKVRIVRLPPPPEEDESTPGS